VILKLNKQKLSPYNNFKFLRENRESNTGLTTITFTNLYPSVSAKGNNIHDVWHDDKVGNWEIYYKRSTNNGESCGSDIRLKNDTATSEIPTGLVDGNYIHVLWFDERDGNKEMHYLQSLIQQSFDDFIEHTIKATTPLRLFTEKIIDPIILAIKNILKKQEEEYMKIK
jgi:hypothetical protein